MAGYNIKDPDCVMFPGLCGGGRRPTFQKAVSERACLYRLREAGAALAKARAAAAMIGTPHPFADFDLSRLGTHPMKRRSSRC